MSSADVSEDQIREDIRWTIFRGVYATGEFLTAYNGLLKSHLERNEADVRKYDLQLEQLKASAQSAGSELTARVARSEDFIKTNPGAYERIFKEVLIEAREKRASIGANIEDLRQLLQQAVSEETDLPAEALNDVKRTLDEAQRLLES